MFGVIAASSLSRVLGVTIPNNPMPATIAILNIGDSISRGTSNGTTDAIDGILEEWDGTQMVAITTDVINANTGTPYPSMAAKLVELGATKLQVVNSGSSGARIIYSHNTNHWATGGDLYAPMVTKANNFLTNQGRSKFDFIRITLGINDIVQSQNNTIEDIKNGYLDLITRLKTDFPDTRFILNNLGFDLDEELPVNHTLLREYIDELILGDSIVYGGKDLLDFPFSTYYDGIHLDQPTNNLFGEYDAVQMADILTANKPTISISTPVEGQFFYQDKIIKITSNIKE
jgi:hypothetical protein